MDSEPIKPQLSSMLKGKMTLTVEWDDNFAGWAKVITIAAIVGGLTFYGFASLLCNLFR